MENYIWTMTMASWTPLIIHDSYELQTSMISDHSKWGFIRFTRSMITHDCYEHWLWAITVHRNSYEFGFWTINDQTHHTWWGGINAMKCWCSYMINTDSVSYYDPYSTHKCFVLPVIQHTNVLAGYLFNLQTCFVFVWKQQHSLSEKLGIGTILCFRFKIRGQFESGGTTFFRISTWREHFVGTHVAGALDQTCHIKPTCTWRDHSTQKIHATSQ